MGFRCGRVVEKQVHLTRVQTLCVRVHVSFLYMCRATRVTAIVAVAATVDVGVTAIVTVTTVAVTVLVNKPVPIIFQNFFCIVTRQCLYKAMCRGVDNSKNRFFVACRPLSDFLLAEPMVLEA